MEAARDASQNLTGAFSYALLSWPHSLPLVPNKANTNINPLMISSYATLFTTKVATPSSSDRHLICTVTPVFAEYAILTIAATLPPVTVLPYNLRVCVLGLKATSLPSKGCIESVFASCSVASTKIINKHLKHDDYQELTSNTLDVAQL